jgi:hypothetical protein
MDDITKTKEEVTGSKKVWKAPDIEIINSKLTSGGSLPNNQEDADYYNIYSS